MNILNFQVLIITIVLLGLVVFINNKLSYVEPKLSLGLVFS